MNPILNGQCSDSTPADVKMMKQRCHVLYETLSGCVQVGLVLDVRLIFARYQGLDENLGICTIYDMVCSGESLSDLEVYSL